MRQFSASAGGIYAVPQGANPTPIQLALIKSASVDVKQQKVALRGPYKAPVDFGDGDLDITIKIQHADFRATSIGMLSAGSTTVVGSKLIAPGEQFTIPSTPFQVTVANSGVFSEDAGVYDVTTQKWMTRGATSTGANVYAVAAGVYTFNTADVGHIVMVFYAYTSASVGATTTFTNQTQGPSTFFLVRVYNLYTLGGVVKPTGWEFPQVHFQSLSMALKVKDWTEISLEGMASADLGQTLYKAYLGD